MGMRRYLLVLDMDLLAVDAELDLARRRLGARLIVFPPGTGAADRTSLT